MSIDPKSTSLRPVIGLDIGRSSVKAVTRTRNGTGPQKLAFPAVVANAFDISTESEQTRAAIETVTINDRSYFYGDTAAIQTRADIDSGLRDDWIFTDEHKALFLGAIKRLKHEGLDRSDEALGRVMAKLSGPSTDMHASGTRGVHDHDFPWWAEIHCRALPVVVEFPHTGGGFRVNHKVHDLGGHIAVLGNSEPVDFIPVTPIEPIPQIVQQGVQR